MASIAVSSAPMAAISIAHYGRRDLAAETPIAAKIFSRAASAGAIAAMLGCGYNCRVSITIFPVKGTVR